MGDKVNSEGDEGKIDLSTIPTQAAARLAAMDSISNHRVQQLADDNEMSVEDIRSAETATPTDETVVIPAEEVTPPENEDQVLASLLDDDAMGSTMVSITVNGEVKQVSVADLVVDAQKVRAATQNFEEAARIRRETEEMIRQNKEAAVPVVVPATEDEEDNDSLPNMDVVKKAVESLYSGDEESATAALLELLKHTGRGDTTLATEQQSVDVNDIAAQVTEQIRRNDALDEFKANYPDVWSNPALATEADRILATKMDEGIPFNEALTASGEEVRGQIAKAAEALGYAKKDETPPKVPVDKKARKESIDNVTGSGDIASTTVAKEAQQTVSSVIAEMAASRGANRHYNA